MSAIYDRVKLSFDRQGIMQTINASLDKVESGMVQISCPFNSGLTQQHGFFHAGVLTTITDSACGYAAATVAAENIGVLTVEFKVNFLRPANTPKIIAIAKVIKGGKTLVVCEGEVYNEDQTVLIAKMTATIILLVQ